MALSFIRLWNHSSYESALSASGIKLPFFFSGKFDIKQQKATFSEQGKREGMRHDTNV